MTTLSTPQPFLEDPLQSIAANLRLTAENLSRRLLSLSADPEASLDEIGKLQRALTGILNTLKCHPAPEPQSVPPEIVAQDSVAKPVKKQPVREPQADCATHSEPDVITPHKPAPEQSADPEPELGPSHAPAPVPAHPKEAPPAPKPTPPQKIAPTRKKLPQARSQKAPKYLRRMMKRARRNRPRPKK